MDLSIVSDGTAQEDRLLSALKPGYFKVDELRFEDLLAMATGYARALKFHEAGKESAGDWRALFQADEVCVLAEILALRADLLEAEFTGFLENWRPALGEIGRGRGDLARLPGYALARRIDAWYVRLGRLPGVGAGLARERIENVIRKSLAQEVGALANFLVGAAGAEAGAGFRGFNPIWGLAEVNPLRLHEAATARFLAANFHALLDGFIFLQEGARAWMALALERHDHEPALGLFIAFLTLFGKVQAKLNQFDRKHLEFYYGQVLRTRRRDFIPDSAYLMLAPDLPGREVVIPKGAVFLAGRDEDGVELLYAADDELLVTDAKVVDLYTLDLERNAKRSPENALTSPLAEGDRQFVTDIKLRRIDPQPNLKAAEAWPLFGGQRQDGERQSVEWARVGFAVASDVLAMRHGARAVTLTLRFAPQPGGLGLKGFTRRLAAHLNTSEADAFNKAFRNMFRIYLTTETGWRQVDDYLPQVAANGQGEGDLVLQFEAPERAGAIIGYSPALHPGGFDTTLPVVQFVLSPDAYLFGYSLLTELVVREIVVEVSVTGCTDIAMSSQLGALSADAQFLPFGPMPGGGDYFVIGCAEAAHKTLQDFEVEFEWGGLPYGVDGFADYYRNYPMRFDDDIFRARIAVLRDRKWLPTEEEDQPEIALFETVAAADGNRRLSAASRLSFRDVARLGRRTDEPGEARFAFGPQSRDGFFRLRLSNPPQAFGHKEYPLVMAAAATENAKRKRMGLPGLLTKSLPPAPLPNPPYTPLLNAVRVNYRAISTIRMDALASGVQHDRVFLVHPLGVERIASDAASRRRRLVPDIDREGNLVIGLTGSRIEGRLTLFFQLRDDSLSAAAAGPFQFTWTYLASNQWKPLAPERVLSDTTQGFLVSGVVTLDIPADIDRDNTLLPKDRYWLRVATDDPRRNALCSLYGIHAQALKATWLPQPGNAATHLAATLPAGTIRSAKANLPGIAAISQPMPSWGGAPAEREAEWVTRVAERLNHKNRAVTAWDYERLVLQNFPEIDKVKCFPGMAGGLVLVLIPSPKEPVAINPTPMVSAHVLREVGDFVKKHASPFAHIEVWNPSYEHIQVRCQVRFRAGQGDGRAIKALNQALCDHLSPWREGGRQVGFGWCIRCDDVQSFLLGLDDIESVTALSLLHIWEESQEIFRFTDTAVQQQCEVRPARPWSIAIPLRSHLIESVAEGVIGPPKPTGISDLSIGSTFILSRG